MHSRIYVTIRLLATFTDSQHAALRQKAATDAGVYVFQLLDEAGSAAATTITDF